MGEGGAKDLICIFDWLSIEDCDSVATPIPQLVVISSNNISKWDACSVEIAKLLLFFSVFLVCSLIRLWVIGFNRINRCAIISSNVMFFLFDKLWFGGIRMTNASLHKGEDVKPFIRIFVDDIPASIFPDLSDVIS